MRTKRLLWLAVALLFIAAQLQAATSSAPFGMGKNVKMVGAGTGPQWYKTITKAMAAIPDQSALPCWDNDWIKLDWTACTADNTITTFTHQPTLPIQITIDPAVAPGVVTDNRTYSYVITGKNSANATITETLTWTYTTMHGMQTTGQYFKSITSIAYSAVGTTTDTGTTQVGVGLQLPTYTVLVMPGVYNEQVTVKQFVTLRGLDRDACLIEYGTGVADTANEYVVNIQKDAVCENLTILSGHQYGDALDIQEYTSPIVGMGIPSTDVAPDRATLRNCTLKSWHQLQFGVNAGWVSGTRDWYSCTGVCIEDNIIEGAAEQLLAVYFAKKLRYTGNKFAGCTSYTFAQVALADIGGVAGSPTDCPSEWLIANNSGTIETKSFNYVQNGSMNFVILRGWGHQIVNNSVTMIMTGEGTADYTAQVSRIAGVTLGLMWATPVTNKQQQSVVTGNNVTWIYRRSHANFTQAAIVYGEDNGSNTPVYLANNTWTIIQAPGRNGLPAMSQMIPEAKKFRIYGNTGAASVVTVGPNAFQGYSTYTEDTTLDYREEPIANWIDSLASMTVRGGNDTGVYCDTFTVTTAAENTYVAANMPITIPAKSLLKGIIIQSGAPSGTAAGTKTIQYAVGSVANADVDLTDATDYDILAATAALTAANVHGDVVADYTAAYWTGNAAASVYFAADTTIYLNYLGKSVNPSYGNGTVTGVFNVRLLLERLP